jgi:hypothetical protein
MLSRKSISASAFCCLWLVMAVIPTAAQEEPQGPPEEKPKPAGSSLPGLYPGDQNEQDTNAMTPDINPLTGVQSFGVGTLETPHSYWQPGLQWSGSLQSNSYSANSNSSSWLMNNFFMGSLSLLKVWGRSQLAINSSTGGFFSTDNTQGSGYYQQLAAAQTFQFNRLLVQLIDQFAYLPQSSFGFGGGSSLGIPGVGNIGPSIPGLGNNYVPNQGILTAIGPRYSNASVVQMTYSLTPRASITASGSYGLLNFIDEGNVSSDVTTATVGYNYALNRSDSVGVFYRFSGFHFSGQPEAYGDHAFNVAYGKKITGHLGLQLYGGPDITTTRIVVNGESSTVRFNVGANLAYAFPRGSVNGGYSHGVSGGSGVFAGSSADQLNFGVNHALGRIWSGQVNFGYSRNAPLSVGPQTVSQTFNTWTVGAGAGRALGRNANFSFAYNATIPDYSQSGCSGPGCGSNNQVYHYVTINLQWHTRPFVLP